MAKMTQARASEIEASNPGHISFTLNWTLGQVNRPTYRAVAALFESGHEVESVCYTGDGERRSKTGYYVDGVWMEPAQVVAFAQGAAR